MTFLNNPKELKLKITKKSVQKHPFFFTLDLIFQRKLLAVWIIIGIIVHQSLRFVVAPLTGDLTDIGVANHDINAVKYYAILILGVTLIAAFFDMTMSWGNEILANDVELHTRSIYFRSIQEKSMAFHDEAKTGELMAVAQNDMRSLYSAMAPGIRIMGESFVSLATIAIIIYTESWILGIIFTIMLPFWLLILRSYARSLTPVAITQQNNFRYLSAEVQENLAASQVVRAFSQEHKEITKFSKFNQEYTSSWEKRGKVTALYYPMLATYFMGGVLFLVSAYLAITPVITIGGLNIQSKFGLGGLVTIIVLIIQLRGPANQISFVLEFWSLGLAGVEKVQQILGIDEHLPIKENPIGNGINGNVTFEHVSFSYKNGTTILDDINFSVKKGDIVAIVGATGSGKSTLLKLITRLYDPTKGKILIDGIDIKDYDPEVVRSSIAVVEQDIFLFSNSIKDNITYALDKGKYTEDDIDNVVKLSRINEFIDEFPKGLDTMVGERGVRLSGGQKQRVAIARAFLVDPKILILDDATSAVDGKTESEIVAALKDLMKDRTTFMVTNRLNMIRQADFIIVLEDGRLTGTGVHNDLIKNNLIYKRIFDPHMELEGISEGI